MPVKAVKHGSKWVVVEAATGKVTPSSGHFATKAGAQAQARAINANLHPRPHPHKSKNRGRKNK